MKNTYGLWTFTSVLILNCFVGSSFQQVPAIISHACYGTDPTCDFFSLQCSSNSIIRFANLIAGRKDALMCPQDNHCGKTPDCCSYKYADPTATFTMENTYQAYQNCSGRTNCSHIQAPWQVINTTTGAPSSYVQLEYVCDNVVDKMPLCGGPFKKSNKVTNSNDIWFDGSTETFDPTKASKECKCSFTNLHAQTSVTLILDWIDVRLESHYRDVNASSAMCSSAIFTPEGFFRRCKESTEHWKDNFIYYNLVRPHNITLSPGQTTEVLLKDIHKNGARDSPAMIWFKARAFPDILLNLTCEEVIPAVFTTTTSTTTTTSPPTTTPQPTPTTPEQTTTPQPTTTTPQPTTTQQPTTTAPQPTTTQQPTTTTKPTTTPQTTATSQPPIPTPQPTTTPQPTENTPLPTITTPQRTTQVPTTKEGGKMNQLYYLAIFIPIGVAFTMFVIFVMWCYYKRTSNNDVMIAHSSKPRTRSEKYRILLGSRSPMDDFIKRENGTLNQFSHGSRPGSLHVGKPLYAVVQQRNPEKPSVTENSLYSEPMRPGPYILPVHVNNDFQHNGGPIAKGGNTPVQRDYYIRLQDSRKTPMTNGDPSGNVGAGSNPTSALTQSTKDVSDVYDPSNSLPESTTSDNVKSTSGSLFDNDKVLENGAVTIHVNNLSYPSVPSSARSGTSSGNSGT
ncbi:mucin-5AC-like isoform X2 [Dreissena polymorpha]|uniref:Uncharacterized protein n=1 Tax=Dreissena polymorpha TaxID=45954 RepID=A0A9D4HU47_DREPO|nr:mucin-5AC-like isoform X2 [Dreissena polymorpha]KAH3735220.1 hypothetical protein DPMN_041682 [Dreissena polymorpha]